MTALEPRADRLAQGRRASRCGIIRESLRAARKRIEEQLRCRMARLADRQADRRFLRVRHYACKERSQPLERIRLQLREVRIQNVARKKRGDRLSETGLYVTSTRSSALAARAWKIAA